MAGDAKSLSRKVFEIVKEENNQLFLSAASGWEIAMLEQLDRVELPDSSQRFVPEAMKVLNVSPVPIGFTTAISAARLPLIHRDPFDRAIIAEALKEKLTILTKEKLFAEYDATILW